MDATSLSISQLKAELARRGISIDGCVEKRELVHLLQDAAAPASKRRRPSPEKAPEPPPSPPPPPPAASHEACVKRRLVDALPRSYLPKEPDPERLFEPHSAPPLHAGATLRVATWNLLETVSGPNDPRGMHAVFDLRRVNVLRLLLALDADVVLLQELCEASRSFLRAVLPSHTLVGHFLLRTAPSERGVWLEPLEEAERHVLVGHGPTGPPRKPLAKQTGPRGYVAHLVVRVRGLAAEREAGEAEAEAEAPRLALASTHLANFTNGQMDKTDKEARLFLATLGRQLLRLPAKHRAPLLLGGDFNAGKHGTGSLHDLLTGRRPPEPYDSEDEWPGDEGELRWPPDTQRAPVRLARDLWRARCAEMRRDAL